MDDNCSATEQAGPIYLYKCKYDGSTCDKCNETIAKDNNLNAHLQVHDQSPNNISDIIQFDGNASMDELSNSFSQCGTFTLSKTMAEGRACVSNSVTIYNIHLPFS